MNNKSAMILLGLSLLFVLCSPTSDIVTQISTIDALLAGLYDGHMSCAALLKHGDFGIGTFHRLDGEMVVLNGEVFQVKASGEICLIGRDMETPFASVCAFQEDLTFQTDDTVSFMELEKLIDGAVPNQNIFCAIKVKGHFSKMKTRSVPMQSKPYPPLSEVGKKQSIFEMEEVTGTIVGFRCPPYVQGINVPGYHLHFLSDDLKHGGHILGFEMPRGQCEIDICHQFFLILPEGEEDFQNLDLTKDRSKALDMVEREQ